MKLISEVKKKSKQVNIHVLTGLERVGPLCPSCWGRQQPRPQQASSHTAAGAEGPSSRRRSRTTAVRHTRHVLGDTLVTFLTRVPAAGSDPGGVSAAGVCLWVWTAHLLLARPCCLLRGRLKEQRSGILSFWSPLVNF